MVGFWRQELRAQGSDITVNVIKASTINIYQLETINYSLIGDCLIVRLLEGRLLEARDKTGLS
jgi:hypothetical protein